MGTDVFVYHGYSHVYIDGRWLKATPAFNSELCARFGVAPIDFTGDSDALLHAHSADGSTHMEYVRGVCSTTCLSTTSLRPSQKPTAL